MLKVLTDNQPAQRNKTSVIKRQLEPMLKVLTDNQPAQRNKTSVRTNAKSAD